MKPLHHGVRTTIWVVVIALVAFVFANWGFFVKNVSFWWQRDVSGSWTALAGELEEPNRIRVASLDIEAPLIYIDEVGEGPFQEALAQGVVHYPGTALPGQTGNAFYFGHSSDFAYKPGEYKTVFALLPQVAVGDVVEVSDARGRVYSYEIYNTMVVSPTQIEVLGQGDGNERLLTLQTSYPVGTAFKRFIVQAKLI
ncbi:MAG: sortase [Patescibacteria group bacterium]|nr:sortase [Patescibacteria group bacterium]